VSTKKRFPRICYASFHENEPYLKVSQGYHPSIASVSKKVTTNPVALSADTNGVFITGANASGKSTYIKSVGINIVCAQTLGIAFASTFEITPFSLICSQMNIMDCKGKESLFEAEMNRIHQNLHDIEVVNALGQPSILFLDELFNSTNYPEAVAATYAICKNLKTITNNMCVFATHYHELAIKPNLFATLKMDAIVNDSNITFPYKIEKGVSHQLLALELMKRKGFNEEIIDDAIVIKNQIQSNTRVQI
jgi:DNA mismatch repair ATPase MutS